MATLPRADTVGNFYDLAFKWYLYFQMIWANDLFLTELNGFRIFGRWCSSDKNYLLISNKHSNFNYRLLELRYRLKCELKLS